MTHKRAKFSSVLSIQWSKIFPLFLFLFLSGCSHTFAQNKEWQPVQKGIEFSLQNKIHVFRADLSILKLEFLSSTEKKFSPDSNIQSLAKKHNYVLSTNASMYKPDGSTTSYAKNFEFIVNPNYSARYNGLIAFAPKKENLKSVTVIDRATNGWQKKVDSYNVVIANIRMISNFKPIYWKNPSLYHGMVAFAVDEKAEYAYLLMAKENMTADNFIDHVLALPFAVQDMVYLEGGNHSVIWFHQKTFEYGLPLSLPQILGFKLK